VTLPPSCTHPPAAAQNCGINCAQIATVPMNSVIDANVAASSMKIFNIAGLPSDTSSGLSNLGVGDRSCLKLRLSKNRLRFS
jgi:hypothetical protein